ncbi:MAG: hypothetical protein J2P37_07345 [Ktedonobacteraceae bacterium]|nr:hypothetical protein [Ktedonobacteraceae bacterium]
MLGRTYPESVLSRVLDATQWTRRLDKRGYVRFNHWKFFGEDGLAGSEVSVWMYEGTLKIAFQATALSEYALSLSADHKRIEAVKSARRMETHFRSPQLHLWQSSDAEWILALRQPERQKHPKRRMPDGIIQLRFPEMDTDPPRQALS